MGVFLHGWREERQTVFGVPDEVEVDFAVVVARHGHLGLKPGSEKPRERG
jgi:hypothetical protein